MLKLLESQSKVFAGWTSPQASERLDRFPPFPNQLLLLLRQVRENSVLLNWTAPVFPLSACWDWGFIDWQR